MRAGNFFASKNILWRKIILFYFFRAMLEGQKYTFGAKTDFVDILRCPDITKETFLQYF